ncbi:hypothetical protein OV090_12525 [Nannocystis sp. RBIL2]|uniref:hypothetical protein n=1 Tax=Nannocystis sp. RBIL2 TaxID=2996788 RepID=UPI00226D844D|nr:hypothetical protein [Nannocystis sp. RBIL2]MCY1065597.1 hypothetical protein [Nannocystis sp. RBIL2]
MAPFDKTTPILRFRRGKVPGAVWILWPVFVWRVVAPVPREQRLNLFQRAVLALARAGVVHVVDLAERLMIAPDLAGLVVQELRGMGLLDHIARPTRRGLQTLDDIELDPPEDATFGHVLCDPFTGKPWPRFVTGDLPLADVEPDEDGWPVLLGGSAGDPWKDRTFSVTPGPSDPQRFARPDASDVLRVARRHRRHRDLGDADPRDVPRLQRVSFVDERPQSYWLAVCVRRHESGDWMVEDPFGGGESLGLRAQLEVHLDRHKELRRRITGLVRDDAGPPSLIQLHTQATLEVEDRLTMSIRQHEPVRERLVAMQRAWLEASQDGAPADKWDDVLVKAQRAAERALRTVHEPRRGLTPPLHAELAESDKALNQQLLDAIAGELGFSTPLPATLASVRRGKVQHAESSSSGSLRPLVVLALLGADRDPAHPLRRAARQHTDLLARLDTLAQARDRAAHDSDRQPGRAVERHCETAFLVVEALLLHR